MHYRAGNIAWCTTQELQCACHLSDRKECVAMVWKTKFYTWNMVLMEIEIEAPELFILII